MARSFPAFHQVQIPVRFVHIQSLSGHIKDECEKMGIRPASSFKSFLKKQMNTRRGLIVMTVIKHIVLVAVTWVLWWAYGGEVAEAIHIENIENQALIIIGLLLAGGIAGRFSFSYDPESTKSLATVGHLTTFVVSLTIGLLLAEAAGILGRSLGSHHNEIRGMFSLAYSSVVVYDFWDLIRNTESNHQVAAGTPAGGTGSGSGAVAAAADAQAAAAAADSLAAARDTLAATAVKAAEAAKSAAATAQVAAKAQVKKAAEAKKGATEAAG